MILVGQGVGYTSPLGIVVVEGVVTDATDTGKWNALRNIVYYSPSYPGFKKNIEGIRQFYYGDEAKDYGVAHLALAYVYAGRPSDMATWGGTHASACGDVWTRAKALADAMIHLADHPEEAARLGKNAEMIRTTFHPDRIAARWEKCIDELSTDWRR